MRQKVNCQVESRAVGPSLSILMIATVALMALATAALAAPKQLLILTGNPDGHPVGAHEYAAGAKIMADCLKPCTDLAVTIVKVDDKWPEGPDLLQKADGVVIYTGEGAKWVSADPRRLDALGKLAARKGGISALHWAIGTKPPEPIEAFQKLLGACHGGPDRKYKVLETTLTPSAEPNPITRGLGPIKLKDEFYYQLKFVKGDDARDLKPVATVEIEGEKPTISWSWQRPDGGRSFGFSGLHFHENWRQETYRRLVAQGILWTMNIEIPEAGLKLGDVPEEDFVLPKR